MHLESGIILACEQKESQPEGWPGKSYTVEGEAEHDGFCGAWFCRGGGGGRGWHTVRWTLKIRAGPEKGKQVCKYLVRKYIPYPSSLPSFSHCASCPWLGVRVLAKEKTLTPNFITISSF